MKTFLLWGGITLAVLAVPSVIFGWSLLQRYFWAGPKGAVEQKEQTNKGNYRIRAYDRFYEIVEEVDGIKLKLAAYPQKLDVRQRTECIGLLSIRANLVAEYNAKSKAVNTTGQWKASGLPYTLRQENPRKC